VSFDEWLAFALNTYKTICATALPKVKIIYIFVKATTTFN
jgi:hypothetical protein